MNTSTFSVRLLAAVIGFYIAYTIIYQMVNEKIRGVYDPTHFFGYFTMQSGGFTALVMIFTAIVACEILHSSSLDFFRGAATLYMTVTIIVYHTLESPWGTWKIDTWSPIHVFAPIVALILWFGFLQPMHQRVKWWWPLIWMVYPAVFAAASVVRGSIDGWYPYGFLNVTENGFSSVATMIIRLAVAVAILGYVLILPSFIKSKRALLI